MNTEWWKHPDRPCRGRTDEWFLEGVKTSAVHAEAERLVAICHRCPVLAECRADTERNRGALDFGVQGGVFRIPRSVRLRRKART